MNFTGVVEAVESESGVIAKVASEEANEDAILKLYRQRLAVFEVPSERDSEVAFDEVPGCSPVGGVDRRAR